MHLAYGARALAAVTLGVAMAATAAPTAAMATAAGVTVAPGVQHQQRESRGGPSTTAECEQSLHIACYNPAQVQRA